VCLQHTVLEATTFDASAIEADIAQEVADDLNRLPFFDYHPHHPQSLVAHLSGAPESKNQPFCELNQHLFNLAGARAGREHRKGTFT
jgi:hypothetical protein